MTEKVTFTAYLKDAMSSGFSKIMKSGNSAFGKLENENRKLERTMLRTGRNIDGLREKLDQLERTRNISLDTRQIRQANREIERTQREIDRLENLGRRGGLGGMLKNNMAGYIGMGMVTAGATNIIGQSIDVSSERQRLRAVLSTALSSDVQADREMERIRTFATETPFQVTELTDGFVRLTNQGFRPSVKELYKLGDLASSTGKDFNMLVEAILDAQVGEFERLKEFGIRAEKHGEKVKFSFRGIPTEVQFTEKAIQKYLLSLGDLQGVSGSMKKQMEQLGGATSNLKDNWDNLLESIGNMKAWKMGISALSSFLEKTNLSAKVTGAIQDSPYLTTWQKLNPFKKRYDTDVAYTMPMKAAEFADKQMESIMQRLKDVENSKAISALKFMRTGKVADMETLRGNRELSDLGLADAYKYEKLRQLVVRIDDMLNNPGNVGKVKGGGSGTGTGTGVTGGIDAGLSSVTGDNRTVRNIHINIGKQVESLYIQSQTMEQGADQFAEHLKRVLLTAVNDANRIAG